MNEFDICNMCKDYVNNSSKACDICYLHEKEDLYNNKEPRVSLRKNHNKEN